MNNEKIERQTPLAEQILRIIDGRIRNGVYITGSLLPSESDLANEFDVSRSTVRSALSILASSSQIVRRPGKGTYVSKVSLIENPINRAMEFHQLISGAGFKPGVRIQRATAKHADETDARSLSIEVGNRLLIIQKVFTADGNPLIYVNTSIPEWVLLSQFEMVLKDPGVTEPLFSFLEKKCGQKVENMVATLWPQTVKGCKEECELEIDDHSPDTPVLMMDYIAYNNDDVPLFQSLQAYLSKNMKFNLIRRRQVTT